MNITKRLTDTENKLVVIPVRWRGKTGIGD